MEVTLLGAKYVIQSDTMISMSNAREFLTYKLELSKLYPLHSAAGDGGDLLLPGRLNSGVVLARLASNQVPCDLVFSLAPGHDTHLEDTCTVLLLDSKTRIDAQPVKGFNLKAVKDKSIAIMLRYKFPVLPNLEKRVVGKMVLEGLFVRHSDTIAKKTEATLLLGNTRSLKFAYRSIGDILSLEVENQLGFPISFDTLTVEGSQIGQNIKLEAKEVYSIFHDNSEKKSQTVPLNLTYTIGSSIATLNPILKEIDATTFEDIIKEENNAISPSQSIKIDLANPIAGLAFRVIVSAPSESELHTVFKVTVDVENLRKLPCLVQMSDRNLENMLIIDKNSVLCDFDRLSSKSTQVTFEVLPLKTGYLKIPDILILPVDGQSEETRASVEMRNAFVKISTQNEVACIHTNNLFNDKVQEV